MSIGSGGGDGASSDPGRDNYDDGNTGVDVDITIEYDPIQDQVATAHVTRIRSRDGDSDQPEGSQPEGRPNQRKTNHRKTLAQISEGVRALAPIEPVPFIFQLGLDEWTSSPEPEPIIQIPNARWQGMSHKKAADEAVTEAEVAALGPKPEPEPEPEPKPAATFQCDSSSNLTSLRQRVKVAAEAAPEAALIAAIAVLTEEAPDDALLQAESKHDQVEESYTIFFIEVDPNYDHTLTLIVRLSRL